MRKIISVFLLCLPLLAVAQDQKDQKPATLRSILIDQLKSTHTEQDWFVTTTTAVDGLTSEQANWTDGKGNHSIGQLASHLIYWNTYMLAKIKGETLPPYSGKNDDTFKNIDAKQWTETVQQLDRVMTEIEKFVEAAADKTIEKNAPVIARIGTHNAYHVGQIIYVRKLQGCWNPAKGVK